MSPESKRRTRSAQGENEKTSPELFVEIGVEEIPSNVMAATLQRLRELAAERLKAHSIPSGPPQSYGTPRRLILYIPGVSTEQETKTETITGPAKKVAFDPQGNPTPAAIGFAKSQGVAVSDLTVRRTEKGEYLAIEKRLEGQATFPLLEKMIPEMIGGLRFPRSMRWNGEGVSFVRPIRWIVALFDGKVVPFSYAGVRSGNTSTGHRIMAPEPFQVKDFASYQTEMRERFVLIDPNERYQKIREEMQALADEKKGKIEEDESLVWQAAFMVEYPKALCGSFDRPFLEVPKEVIVTAMKEHQGYFPLQSKDGALLPNFITIINVEPKKPEIIQKGNERVLRARLVDAKFYFEQDRKSKLSDREDGLKGITFQEKLGTLFKKMDRLISLAPLLARRASPYANPLNIFRAARLCKIDLLSGVVREFPSLQGTMGRIYAEMDGESPATAAAIQEHYLPRFSGDALPKTLEGQVLAVADKLDTIVGCFGVNLIPSGSEDPYALRRQGLGLVQILVSNPSLHSISLHEAIEEAIRYYQDQGILFDVPDDQHRREVRVFLKQRVASYLQSEKIRYDLIDVVLALNLDHPHVIVDFAKALAQFSKRSLFGPLMTSYKRAIRILPKGFLGQVDNALLKENVEKELQGAIVRISEVISNYWIQGQYEQVLEMLTTLCEPLNQFFEGVMVMDADLDVRQNRLSLLFRVQQLFSEFGDFSKVVEDEPSSKAGTR